MFAGAGRIVESFYRPCASAKFAFPCSPRLVLEEFIYCGGIRDMV